MAVSAGNAQGLSGWSKPSKKVKTLSACPPLAPAMPQILQTTPNSVLLSWSEPDCLGAPIKGYTIEVSNLGLGAERLSWKMERPHVY